MIIIPKSIRRNNQQKIDKSSKKRLNTNNRMIDSISQSKGMIPSAKKFPMPVDYEQSRKNDIGNEKNE